MLTFILIGLAGCALILYAQVRELRESRVYGTPYYTSTLGDIR